jgi:hypothetical protein
VKKRVDRGREAEFMAFNYISQEKAAHGHVVHAVQEVPFWAPFNAVFDTSCPGNERCGVEMISELPNPLNAWGGPVKLYRPAISYISIWMAHLSGIAEVRA